jgi:hypothetical protein
LIVGLIVILSLINFTPETGSYTPFQLKFGTQDAEHFKLQINITPGAKAVECIKQLDEVFSQVSESCCSGQ